MATAASYRVQYRDVDGAVLDADEVVLLNEKIKAFSEALLVLYDAGVRVNVTYYD